jgi:radical SAM protein with 4Fe4S-binding SPASM domain
MTDAGVPIRELDLHLTNRCNLACKHCSVDSGTGRTVWDELPVNVWNKVINAAAGIGCTHIDFTGGEPALYPQIAELIGQARGHGMSAQVQTNGIAFTRSRLVLLIDAGVSTFVISLDGTSRVHDRIRGLAGSYKRALDAIRLARSLNAAVRVTRVFVEPPELDEVHEWLATLSALGVAHVSINQFSPVTREQLRGWRPISAQDWCSLTTYLDRCAAGLPFPLTFQVGWGKPDWEASEETRCLIARRAWFLVRSDGEVFPCYHFVHRPELSLGNITTRPFEQIVAATNPQWDTWQGIYKIPIACAGCAHSVVCGGGCPSIGYKATGSLSEKDVRCEIEEGYLPLCPFIKRRAGTTRQTNISPYYS